MREVFNINRGWMFGKGTDEVPTSFPEEGAGWKYIDLPHSWNDIDGMMGKPYLRDIFWYVTSLEPVEQPLEGGRTYLEIGAAAFIAEVYVNGQKVGSHVGGYSMFRFDITDTMTDGENILAIRVDNRYSDKYYPQMADFTFYGGIYRDVNVISVCQSHICLDDQGSCGIYIDADPCEGGAKVCAKVLLDGVKEKQYVGLQIFDENDEQVAEVYEEAQATTLLGTFLPDAKLWDGPKSPYMYRAVVTLASYNEVLDQNETSFGIRSFEIDQEKGFLLNGRSHNLRGVCRHQDRLYKGPAIGREECEEDADLIAEMGANGVRLAHYQQCHDIYEAFDKRGILVWAEIPYFAKSWDDDAHAAALNEIQELVKQNYNHPSIFCWGLSNEVLMGQDSEKLIPCHKELNEAVKALDGKRYTTIAHEYTTPWDHELHAISDIEGWNHYFGWYRGTTEDFATWMDDYHAKYPERRVSISEYGCDCIIAYHTEKPEKMDYTEEYQAYLHEEALKDFAERPFIWGTFVWNMFDFGSAIRHEGGTHGRNNKGLVTMDRKIKKDAFYVYKAWLSEDPFVHIDGRRFFARPGQTTTIQVHSNLNEVELYVDGKFFGRQTGEHCFVFENVPIAPEGTAITAVSGGLRDTISLRSTAELLDRFTNPDFKFATDAKNWFDNVEVVTDRLEAKEGYYSVFDTVGEIHASKEASAVIGKTMTAILERIIDVERIFGGLDPEQTFAEASGEGMLAIFLGKKREKALAAINSSLTQIRK